MNWTLFLDLVAGAFVMFFLIGSRFNEWTKVSESVLPGKPSDYIHPFQYYTFFFFYVTAVLIIGLAAYNVGILKTSGPQSEPAVVVADSVEVSTTSANQPEQPGSTISKFDNMSWALIAFALFCIVSQKPVSEWDDRLRCGLHGLAGIPEDVLEMKRKLMGHQYKFTPTEDRLNEIRREMFEIGAGDSWKPGMENWSQHRENKSLEWLFLKSVYLFRISKHMQGNMLNDADMKRHEALLRNLAGVIPTPGRTTEDINHDRDELIKLLDNLTENFCRYIIWKYPSKKAQGNALKDWGFELSQHFSDKFETKIVAPVLRCVSWISIVCFVTICAYLAVLTWMGFPFNKTEAWFTWARVCLWSLGSIISYSMAIFIAIIIEKAAKDTLPNVIRYLIALVFSTLVSLTFFQVVTLSVPLRWQAYISLALSMGVISIPVVRAFEKKPASTAEDILISSLKHAVVFGLIAAAFQALAAGLFRGFDIIAPIALVISSVYGFVKGASVTFVVSYLIQDSTRIQLLIAQRKTPRARFKVKLSAALWDNTSFPVTTRDVSLGGLQIEHSNKLKKGERVELNFHFGKIMAIVQWTGRKISGLAFLDEEGSKNSNKLRDFIRHKLGVFYA